MLGSKASSSSSFSTNPSLSSSSGLMTTSETTGASTFMADPSHSSMTTASSMATPSPTSSQLLEHQEHEVMRLEENKPHKRVVLVAVDPTPGSRHTLEWAKEYFFQPDDSILLVHVRATQMLIADFHGDLVLAMHQLDEQAKKESHALLHQLAYMLRGWSVVAYAIRGDPRTEVIRKAQESQVNVILVGSRGRGFLQRTMLGSFSDYLVHHAPCPVLVVRPNSSSSSAPTTLNKDTQHEGTEGFTQKASEKEDQKEKKL